MYPAYKLTKSYLNSDHLSWISLDILPKKTGILCKEAKEKCSFKDGEASPDGLLLICENDEMNVNECLKVVGFDVYQFERLLEGAFPMIPLFLFQIYEFKKKKYKQALNN